MIIKNIRNSFGGEIHYKETTQTTMADAREGVLSGSGHGDLFIGGFQSSGKGRIPGRTWESEAEKNLMFTLVLDKDILGKGYSTIPLKAGLGVALGIEKYTGFIPQIKWPNDVFLMDKKISGILCESVKNCILVGIGINVNQKEFSTGARASSLSLLMEKDLSLEELLSSVTEGLFNSVQDKEWLDKVNSRLYLKGEEVEFLEGHPKNNKRVTGILKGLDTNGKVILLQQSGEEKAFLSGEFVLNT